MPSHPPGVRLLSRRQVLHRSIGLACASGMGLTACTAHPPPFRLALNNWVGYTLMFLAQDLGQPAETDMRMLEFPSNTACLLALANGDVEAAALTLDELLLAREGGLNIQTAMVFDESNGADALLAQPHIRSAAELRGLRIGVESSAVGALMLSQVLARAGIPPSDIVKVSLPADQHVSAFVARKVDAVITFEPMASQMLAQGAKRLLDSSQLPGLIVDVLAVRADIDATQKAQLRQALQGYFAALHHFETTPQDAARLLAPHQQLSPDDLLKAFRGIRLIGAADNHAWLTGAHPRLMQSAQLVGGVMQEAQLLHRPPDLANLCAGQYLPEAAT